MIKTILKKNKPKSKIQRLLIIIIIILIVILLLVSIFKFQKNERANHIIKTGDNYLTRKVSTVEYQYNLIQKEYFKNAKAPVFVTARKNKLTNYLNSGLVMDANHKLKVISGHDYAYFKKLRNSKVGDIYQLENVKTKQSLTYRVVRSFEIKASDTKAVYDDKLDVDKSLILYTCSNHGYDLFNPQYRWVIKLTLVE